MTQQTYTPADIVKFALSKDAVNIATAFDQLAGEKVAAAIQARKIEVAKNILGGQQPEEEQQTEVEVEAEEQTDAETETEVTTDDETVAVEDEDNKESEESHENAEQSA